MTIIRPPLLHTTAGFTAGSIPMTGISLYFDLSSDIAADVAVLHATTRAFISYSMSFSTALKVSSRISLTVLVPYGALAESPK